MIKQLRSSWIPYVTTIVLACASTVFAQQSYKITDLGVNKSRDNFNMVMGLNNQGWAENMDGVLNPPIKSTSTTIASGRAVISIYGLNIDLGTLGGDNSWTNYGGINDRGKLSVWPKHLFRIRTVKTCAPLARKKPVVGFFGSTVT